MTKNQTRCPENPKTCLYFTNFVSSLERVSRVLVEVKIVGFGSPSSYFVLVEVKIVGFGSRLAYTLL